MHYIIGTEVYITNNQKRDPRDPSTYRRKTDSNFKPNVRYSLYHIRKDKDIGLVVSSVYQRKAT